MALTKQSRRDVAETARMLRLVLLDDERDDFLTTSDRAALTDADAVLRGKIALDGAREIAKAG